MAHLDRCAVCLAEYGESGLAKAGVLDCRHAFCLGCVTQWAFSSTSCPCCKQHFSRILATTVNSARDVFCRGALPPGQTLEGALRARIIAVPIVDEFGAIDDAEVVCHDRCLLRSANEGRVKADDSVVQCKKPGCERWYHGICVSITQEHGAPSTWLCPRCTGRPPTEQEMLQAAGFSAAKSASASSSTSSNRTRTRASAPPSTTRAAAASAASAKWNAGKPPLKLVAAPWHARQPSGKVNPSSTLYSAHYTPGQDYCHVCGGGDSPEDNLIVMCDHCDVAVHMACYGVSQEAIAQASWLCDACAAGFGPPLSPACALCPAVGGAYKRTTDPSRWAHLKCALWVPGIFVADNTTMGPVCSVCPATGAWGPIEAAPRERFDLRCGLCASKRGASIQCSMDHCCESYHPMCAAVCGHYLEVEEPWTGGGGDATTPVSYCRGHSDARRDAGANAAAREALGLHHRSVSAGNAFGRPSGDADEPDPSAALSDAAQAARYSESELALLLVPGTKVAVFWPCGVPVALQGSRQKSYLAALFDDTGAEQCWVKATVANTFDATEVEPDGTGETRLRYAGPLGVSEWLPLRSDANREWIRPFHEAQELAEAARAAGRVPAAVAAAAAATATTAPARKDAASARASKTAEAESARQQAEDRAESRAAEAAPRAPVAFPLVADSLDALWQSSGAGASGQPLDGDQDGEWEEDEGDDPEDERRRADAENGIDSALFALDNLGGLTGKVQRGADLAQPAAAASSSSPSALAGPVQAVCEELELLGGNSVAARRLVREQAQMLRLLQEQQRRRSAGAELPAENGSGGGDGAQLDSVVNPESESDSGDAGGDPGPPWLCLGCSSLNAGARHTCVVCTRARPVHLEIDADSPAWRRLSQKTRRARMAAAATRVRSERYASGAPSLRAVPLPPGELAAQLAAFGAAVRSKVDRWQAARTVLLAPQVKAAQRVYAEIDRKARLAAAWKAEQARRKGEREHSAAREEEARRRREQDRARAEELRQARVQKEAEMAAKRKEEARLVAAQRAAGRGGKARGAPVDADAGDSDLDVYSNTSSSSESSISNSDDSSDSDSSVDRRKNSKKKLKKETKKSSSKSGAVKKETGTKRKASGPATSGVPRKVARYVSDNDSDEDGKVKRSGPSAALSGALISSVPRKSAAASSESKPVTSARASAAAASPPRAGGAAAPGSPAAAVTQQLMQHKIVPRKAPMSRSAAMAAAVRGHGANAGASAARAQSSAAPAPGSASKPAQLLPASALPAGGSGLQRLRALAQAGQDERAAATTLLARALGAAHSSESSTAEVQRRADRVVTLAGLMERVLHKVVVEAQLAKALAAAGKPAGSDVPPAVVEYVREAYAQRVLFLGAAMRDPRCSARCAEAVREEVDPGVFVRFLMQTAATLQRERAAAVAASKQRGTQARPRHVPTPLQSSQAASRPGAAAKAASASSRQVSPGSQPLRRAVTGSAVPTGLKAVRSDRFDSDDDTDTTSDSSDSEGPRAARRGRLKRASDNWEPSTARDSYWDPDWAPNFPAGPTAGSGRQRFLNVRNLSRLQEQRHLIQAPDDELFPVAPSKGGAVALGATAPPPLPIGVSLLLPGLPDEDGDMNDDDEDELEGTAFAAPSLFGSEAGGLGFGADGGFHAGSDFLDDLFDLPDLPSWDAALGMGLVGSSASSSAPGPSLYMEPPLSPSLAGGPNDDLADLAIAAYFRATGTEPASSADQQGPPSPRV